MPDGPRAIPTTGIGHPLADRVGPPGPDPWVGTETRAPVVSLTQARASLLAMAARDGRRPVLFTDGTSTLTPVLANVWQRAGGAWVVTETSGGLRNGFTGRRLDRVEDAWRLAAPDSLDDVAVNFLRPAAPETVELTVVVSSRLPARDSTLLGEAAERIGTAGPSVRTLSWGPHEPVGFPWDRADLTRTLLRGSPYDEKAVYVAGEGLSGLVSARRTTHGIEELTHVHLDVGEHDPGDLEQDQEWITSALEDLCRSSMPLVGLVWARPVLPEMRVAPFLGAPAFPLVLLLGAPAVRSFGVDVPAMQERFPAQVTGRPRLPALLFDLAIDPGEAWGLLDEILGTLDPVLLAEALGPAAGPLAAARPRTTGGRDAQP